MTESFGARLRAQRERQQMTLETIAERTKIRQALFEGLERDDVSRWPGGIFRRSYFRSYAAAVGLDPDVAVREFIALFPEPAEELAADALAEAEANQAGHGPKMRLHYLLASAIDAVSKPFDKERPTHATHAVAPASVSLDHGRADTLVSGAVEEAAVASAEKIVSDFNDELDGGLELESEPELEVPDDATDQPAGVQVDLAALAQLCTGVAEARTLSDLEALLGEAARILHAVGIIVWPWDQARGVLVPSLTHGYPRQTLARLPTVAPDADNPVAAAFRTSSRQVVDGDGNATSAMVVPMTTRGCVGVLAVEFANGLEGDSTVQALATILAAQVSLAMQHLQRVQAEQASRHAIA